MFDRADQQITAIYKIHHVLNDAQDFSRNISGCPSCNDWTGTPEVIRGYATISQLAQISIIFTSLFSAQCEHSGDTKFVATFLDGQNFFDRGS